MVDLVFCYFRRRDSTIYLRLSCDFKGKSGEFLRVTESELYFGSGLCWGMGGGLVEGKGSTSLR